MRGRHAAVHPTSLPGGDAGRNGCGRATVLWAVRSDAVAVLPPPDTVSCSSIVMSCPPSLLELPQRLAPLFLGLHCAGPHPAPWEHLGRLARAGNHCH